MTLDLCSTFLDLGDAVSKNLTMAHGHGCHVSYGEETITETCLLEIHRRHSKVVNIRTFTKRQEAASGADWEWHLVGRKYSLKMRVQAKRLGKGASHFSGLLTYTARGATKEQIKVLIDDANANFLYPAICLYRPDYLNMRSWATTCEDPSKLIEFGCLIGDAVGIEAGKRSDHAHLEKICVPWHHLVCRDPHPVKTNSPPRVSFPNVRALNSDDSLDGRGVSRTPDDWKLGDGIDDQPGGYIERGIMGVLQIDVRSLG